MRTNLHILPFAAWVFAMADRGFSAPVGMTVQQGAATASQDGHHLSITASHNAFLNWQSFNINAGETARFIQPSAASVVWNRIHDANPSRILGHLEANGVVVLMNESGFYFGPDSFVNAAGLVVSTAPVTPVDASAGLFWQFHGPPPKAGIINYGHLGTSQGGSLFLIGEHIENHGTLSAPGGTASLLAGSEVLLSSRPDGLGLSSPVKLPSGTIRNSGRIVADAGTIALNARVVNQDGLVQANSIRERNGVIELVASESIQLGEHSDISARGGTEGPSRGGNVNLTSDRILQDRAGSRISVTGGAEGGDGGSVEFSAPDMSSIRSAVDARAQAGGRGGSLLIDPQDIVIGASGTGGIGSGEVGSGSPPATGTLQLDVNSAFLGFSQITLQAARNISVAAGTLWDIAASTGLAEPQSLLKLEAGNHVSIASGASILAGENWSVTLHAGRDFSTPDSVRPGVGNIGFSGTASLQAENGNIDLLAGNNITVAGGYVRTVNGGNVSARALGGSINTGTLNNGFIFRPFDRGFPDPYDVHPNLGGISTANGGNVSLTAGQDVISLLPSSGGNPTDAGSGAFGAAPGTVTIQAGRDVQGHFVVRNGTGTIDAGRDGGTAGRLLALSVVNGGWTVHATRDLLLQEVRNPNGTFNNLGSSSSPWYHWFDYSPGTYAILSGGNSVQLRGTGLPRLSDAFEQGITPVYPGRLAITAGAGGVAIGNDVTLFPSPEGGLTLTTTDGGSLVGTRPGDLTQLVVSDSGKTQYREFGDFGVSDHAPVPVHLKDPKPVALDIGGDMSGMLLATPTRADISVAGDMINSRFDGQNLRDSDVTTIHVGGDIINRNEFTSVPLATPPDPGVFDLVYPPLPGAVAGVQNLLTYNAATRELVFQGRMTGDQLQALVNLRVRTFDPNGFPILDASGEPATAPAAFASEAALNQLYERSQDVPLNPDTGYRLGGPGTFDIRARNLDLGATVGIVSQGPRANHALAKDFTHGADINIVLSGSLTMFSTKIATLNGGDISILAGNEVNVGSRTFSVGDANARGIYTTDPSDVTVLARGNIHVNGSRIAAYDGGNLLVRSSEGNIDAGSGGRGAATVEKLDVDPVTREIRTYSPTIPGSGIIATTFPRPLDPSFPPSLNPVGNITVETPRGDIIASAGGVVQMPLNGIGNNLGTVSLAAGTKDPDGRVVHVGNIDASGSGVIGSNVKLDATGNIKGVVFARENLELRAKENVSVTALAGVSADVGAGGNISGTIIGGGSVTATGVSVDAALLSQNVSASGDVGSSQVGFSQGAAAASTSQGMSSEAQARTAATAKPSDGDEDPKRRTNNLPVLARTVGRVTVILPVK